MISIKKCPVPPNTILDRYSTHGAYADCYWTEVPGRVSFSQFVGTFYTTSLFKLERFILKLLVAKPSIDAQARQLADGSGTEFAAWHVECRSENELLMCDFRGRTRSWLKIAFLDSVSDPRTRLYFGSAVVPLQDSKTGKTSFGFGYQALLGFHKIYSILLLHSAARNINARIRDPIDR